MSTQSETGTPNYPPPPPGQDRKSDATKAAICGVIPGVGAVYNQDYMKAVVHLAAFSGLCVFAEANGIFGLFAFVFYVFTIFDAYRSALDPRKKREFSTDQLNMPLWGIVLILIGTLFLLDSLDAISLRSVTRFWPLILVFLGFYMVFQFFVSGRNGKGASRSSAQSFATMKPDIHSDGQSPAAESAVPESLPAEPADEQGKDV